jgi:hypothetical protein
MSIIGRLRVIIDANTEGLRRGLREALDSTDEASKQIISNVKNIAAAFAGGFGAAQFVGKLIDVQRQFDVLNASLITMTGSSEAAQQEFAWLKQFAATTPFDLNQVVGAFVKMTSLGLDPSREALESYGNTASAMGKSLEQMIEAVADAATGEFERLKEFGIKSSKQGDQVTFTFQGIEKTIRNTSEEITKYLNDIGQNQFAGAMAERAKTLDGAISNLGDSWDELFRTINRSNAGGLIADSVSTATDAIENFTKIVEAMGSASDETARQTKSIGIIVEGLSIVFETVAVLGVNVAFVLKSIKKEIVGLADQAKAVARLDFAGAQTIGRLMREDAIAARQEVDRLTAAILTAREAGSAPDAEQPARMPRIAAPQQPAPAPSGTGKTVESFLTDPLADLFEARREREAKALDEQEERERQYWADRIQRVQESLLSESELLEQKYQKDIERLEAAVMTEEERRLAREALELEHLTRMGKIEEEGQAARIKAETDAAAEIERIRQASMTKLERFMAMSYQDQAKHVANSMREQLTSVNTNSRAMFNINKVAAIANALLKAKESVTSAYAFGSKIGGPPLGAAMAGVAAAATAAQVAAIKSQQFGGGMAGVGASAGAASAATTGLAETSAPSMNQTITIQGISSGDLFGGDAVRTLIDRLIDAQRNGARIVLA